MNLNGFLSRLKPSGTNRAQEVHHEVSILSQRLSDLNIQWPISSETKDQEKENSPEGINFLSSGTQSIPERAPRRIHRTKSFAIPRNSKSSRYPAKFSFKEGKKWPRNLSTNAPKPPVHCGASSIAFSIPLQKRRKGIPDNLAAPSMAKAEKYGLNQRHLSKQKRMCEPLYKRIIDSVFCRNGATQKYQHRVLRNPKSHFKFVNEDGIPWNNNIAEKANRHLMPQKKIWNPFFKRIVVQYLRLVRIAQTYPFQKESFLNSGISGYKKS